MCGAMACNTTVKSPIPVELAKLRNVEFPGDEGRTMSYVSPGKTLPVVVMTLILLKMAVSASKSNDPEAVPPSSNATSCRYHVTAAACAAPMEANIAKNANANDLNFMRFPPLSPNQSIDTPGPSKDCQ